MYKKLADTACREIKVKYKTILLGVIWYLTYFVKMLGFPIH